MANSAPPQNYDNHRKFVPEPVNDNETLYGTN